MWKDVPVDGMTFSSNYYNIVSLELLANGILFTGTYQEKWGTS